MVPPIARDVASLLSGEEAWSSKGLAGALLRSRSRRASDRDSEIERSGSVLALSGAIEEEGEGCKLDGLYDCIETVYNALRGAMGATEASSSGSSDDIMPFYKSGGGVGSHCGAECVYSQVSLASDAVLSRVESVIETMRGKEGVLFDIGGESGGVGGSDGDDSDGGSDGSDGSDDSDDSDDSDGGSSGGGGESSGESDGDSSGSDGFERIEAVGGGPAISGEVEDPASSLLRESEEDMDPMGNPMRDGFFDVSEMEAFADEEERYHSRLDDDDDDDDDRGNFDYRPDDELGLLASLYEAGDDDDDYQDDDYQDEEEEVGHVEFFGAPNGKIMDRYKSRYGGKAGGAAKESQRQPTSHDMKAAKLLKKTEALEEELLAEKPWSMTGEVAGSSRPLDSLLSEAPEFEQSRKIAPQLTSESSINIEELIKGRILKEEWDDVLPKEVPTVRKPKGSADEVQVSQEQSKLGLGELYEREYLKKATGYDVEAVEKLTAEDKAKAEMKALFAKLCGKLDALSNYHFTPRPEQEEGEITSVNVPAITMEEKIPLSVSSASCLAPEDVYGSKRGKGSVLKGEGDLGKDDRKRRRADKKREKRKEKRRKRADERVISRLNAASGLSNPYESRKIKEDLEKARGSGMLSTGKMDANKDYNTSKQFFERMQSVIRDDIHGKNDKKAEKKGASSGTSKDLIL